MLVFLSIFYVDFEYTATRNDVICLLTWHLVFYGIFVDRRFQR